MNLERGRVVSTPAYRRRAFLRARGRAGVGNSNAQLPAQLGRTRARAHTRAKRRSAAQRSAAAAVEIATHAADSTRHAACLHHVARPCCVLARVHACTRCAAGRDPHARRAAGADGQQAARRGGHSLPPETDRPRPRRAAGARRRTTGHCRKRTQASRCAQVSVLRTNIEKVKLDMVRIFAGAPNQSRAEWYPATWYPVRQGIPADTSGGPRAAQAPARMWPMIRPLPCMCLLIGALVSTLGIVLATLRFVKTGSPVPRTYWGLLVVWLFVPSVCARRARALVGVYVCVCPHVHARAL